MGAPSDSTTWPGEGRPEGPGEGLLLVRLDGPGLGRRHALSEACLTVGRETASSIVLDHRSVSRRHCLLLCEGRQLVVRDLGSTNGTFVNGRRLGDHEQTGLQPGDLLALGDATFKLIDADSEEARFHAAVDRRLARDPVTEAPGGEILEEHLGREMARCIRHERSLAVLRIDVDGFKELGELLGPARADLVLRHLAGILRSASRDDDGLCHVGGECFALVMPETGLAGARAMAERVCGAVAQDDFELASGQAEVTVSIGVARFSPLMKEQGELLSAADAKLAEAKAGGGNRIAW